MTSHEYPFLPTADEEIIADLSTEENENLQTTLTAAELDVFRRRDLVVQATGALEEVLDEQVTVPGLLRQAESGEASFGRLRARRALRCVQDIGTSDSAVVDAVGEANIYHYVESVVQYGSSKQTYLELMRAYELSAEEVTSIYALRELIAEETDDNRIGFPTLHKALGSVGITMQQAASDPDAALAAFTSAGFFVNYSGARIYDRPIFSPDKPENESELGYHIDNVRSRDSFAWVREFVENAGMYTNEETENE